jgi:hypothetical protein
LSEKLDNAITGQISFNNDGDRLNPIYIFKNVQKYGKIVPVGYYGNKEVNISVVSIINYYKKISRLWPKKPSLSSIIDFQLIRNIQYNYMR